MQTAVTFKNLDPSDHLKAYVNDKLDRFDRFLDNPAEATVVLAVEKHRHIAEIHIMGDRLKINAREETTDMYGAIDMALDKLEKQIKRTKAKVRDHRAKAGAKVEGGGAAGDEEGEAEIIVQEIEYKPMDMEEAALQLDMATDNFIVFTNARSNRVNVIYRRNDGNYGLIQPKQ